MQVQFDCFKFICDTMVMITLVFCFVLLFLMEMEICVLHTLEEDSLAPVLEGQWPAEFSSNPNQTKHT